MARKLAVKTVAASRYWRESTARLMVDAWRASGATVAAFARRQGVDRRRLARWVRRVEAKADVVVPFHPVRVVDDEGARQRPPAIDIEVGLGYRVRVGAGFATDDLRRVITVLEERRTC